MTCFYATPARDTSLIKCVDNAYSRKMARRARLSAERQIKKAGRWAMLSRIVGIDVAPIEVARAEYVA